MGLQGAEAEARLVAAKGEFQTAKRQSLIYGLYSRSYKSVLVRAPGIVVQVQMYGTCRCMGRLHLHLCTMVVCSPQSSLDLKLTSANLWTVLCQC